MELLKAKDDIEDEDIQEMLDEYYRLAKLKGKIIEMLSRYLLSTEYLGMYFGSNQLLPTAGNHTKTIRRRKKYLPISFSKGQLISKCLFGVIVWTKIPTKNLTNFCPRI